MITCFVAISHSNKSTTLITNKQLLWLDRSMLSRCRCANNCLSGDMDCSSSGMLGQAQGHFNRSKSAHFVRGAYIANLTFSVNLNKSILLSGFAYIVLLNFHFCLRLTYIYLLKSINIFHKTPPSFIK